MEGTSKTLKDPLTGRALSYMAGFQVIIYGRFWVFTEAQLADVKHHSWRWTFSACTARI